MKNENDYQRILEMLRLSNERSAGFRVRCLKLVEKLVETEFRKLKPLGFSIIYDRFKEERKGAVALITGDVSQMKEKEGDPLEIVGGHLIILLNSRLRIERWPEKRIKHLLRHELLHVAMKKKDHDLEFRAEMKRRELEFG